ncbi:hypothetical protein SSX86_003696 [Deinandra increscens subsp. villosa]|uniref:Uncharacterized protein n=1 Tax=Deinandra increscens subsp. villosa TaxID=3103831 RepID=A0AAP0H597_9ASTR
MDFETDFGEEFDNFRKRFLELEEKVKKDESRYLMLETEVENLRKKNQELEGRIELIQKGIVDPTHVENDSKILEVMVENKVLECEKRKAETELCVWKEKAKQLESIIKVTNEKVKEEMNATPKGTKEAIHSKFREPLVIEEDECPDNPYKKMSPSTPGVVKSPFHGTIDISDEDVDYKEIPKVKKLYCSRKSDDSAKSCHSSKNNIQKTNLEHTNENHMDEFKFHSSNTRSAKRKRVAKIMTSDDESSNDDDAPISTLKKQNISRVMTDSEEEEVTENASRRRLTRLRRLKSKNKQDNSSFDLTKSVSSTEDEEYNDGVEESESEGESLDGFIVDSSESLSKCDSESGDNIDESEDVVSEYKETSAEDVVSDYKETLEKIARKKKTSNLKWDLEGDMLSDFGKNPTLCMRAVCALYRQQTEDEKELKATLHHNERGFSQPDAPRGSELAEFLLNNDPNGDLVKTEEDLKEFDPEGLERCMSLAAKYSKQVFEIYQNNEDPYFKPE